MAQKHGSTLVADRFIRRLRQFISTKHGTSLTGVTHYLPVSPREGGAPRTYTVCLAPHEHSTFLGTCRELPDLLIIGRTEEEALVNAEVIIREALADRRRSHDFLI